MVRQCASATRAVERRHRRGRPPADADADAGSPHAPGGCYAEYAQENAVAIALSPESERSALRGGRPGHACGGRRPCTPRRRAPGEAADAAELPATEATFPYGGIDVYTAEPAAGRSQRHPPSLPTGSVPNGKRSAIEGPLPCPPRHSTRPRAAVEAGGGRARVPQPHMGAAVERLQSRRRDGRRRLPLARRRRIPRTAPSPPSALPPRRRRRRRVGSRGKTRTLRARMRRAAARWRRRARRPSSRAAGACARRLARAPERRQLASSSAACSSATVGELRGRPTRWRPRRAAGLSRCGGGGHGGGDRLLARAADGRAAERAADGRVGGEGRAGRRGRLLGGFGQLQLLSARAVLRARRVGAEALGGGRRRRTRASASRPRAAPACVERAALWRRARRRRRRGQARALWRREVRAPE